MNSKSYIIFLFVLVLLAVFTYASEDDNTIQEFLSRAAREAYPIGKRNTFDKKKNTIGKKNNKKKQTLRMKEAKKKKNKKGTKSRKKKVNKKNKVRKKDIKKKEKLRKKKSKKKKNKKRNRLRKNKAKKKEKKLRKNEAKKKKNKVEKKRRRKMTTKKKYNKGKEGRCSRQTDGICLENAVTAMTRWLKVVSNYKRQSLRIKGQKNLADKKKGKKGLFSPVMNQLISAGGGNKSALTCAGSSNSSGAAQLKNLTVTLEACMKNINTSCNKQDFPKPNATLIEKCDNSTASFEVEAEKCRKLSKNSTYANACTCWNGMANVSKAVVGCSRTDEQIEIKNATKKCKDAFMKCRKFEDDAVSILKACSESTQKLKQKAAALSKNKDAMTEAKAKIAKTTGSSGRHRRAAANNCGEFIALAVRCK